MNFSYLANKYIPDVKMIVHDRSYEGLEITNGSKPPLEIFESWNRTEMELKRAEGAVEAQKNSYRQDKHMQARARALEDIRPIEDKLREEESQIREEIFRLKREAVRIQETQKTKRALDECWEEISKAQEKINKEARDYLTETDWYVTRMHETGIKIPEEVMEERAKARSRIQHGEVVYSRWAELRKNEMPPKEEMREAMRLGGEELERIKKACFDTIAKYPKPRRLK